MRALKSSNFYGVKKLRLCTLGILFFIFLMVGYSLPCAASAPKPNILIILTDDQGYATIGRYGGKVVATPHLDQLADQGMRFTDAYVTSQCTPTRASLLTGQYTARNRMWHVIGWYGYPWARMTEPLYRENLSRETFNIARGLQQVGYTTGIFGKWHLTTNEDGHYLGLNPAAAAHYGFDQSGEPLPDSDFDEGSDRGVSRLTKQALRFIEDSKDQPWFCLVSHHMIHGKVVAPDSLVKKYRSLGYGDTGPNRAVYLSGLELIDWSVGELVSGLQKMGEADETLVIFVSDNGGIDQKHAFRDLTYQQPKGLQFPIDITEYDNDPLRAGKGSVYEGGVRVPFIFSWPQQIAAKRVDSTPVHIIDLAPTLLEVAGSTTEHHLDGMSLVPLLEGNDSSDYSRPIFQYYPFYDLLWGQTPCASIRIGKYKLIEFFGDYVDESRRYHIAYKLELYDLEKDIGETHNLVAELPDVAKKLKSRLHQWYHDMKVPIPKQNAHFVPSRAFEVTRDKPQWLK